MYQQKNDSKFLELTLVMVLVNSKFWVLVLCLAGTVFKNIFQSDPSFFLCFSLSRLARPLVKVVQQRIITQLNKVIIIICDLWTGIIDSDAFQQSEIKIKLRMGQHDKTMHPTSNMTYQLMLDASLMLMLIAPQGQSVVGFVVYLLVGGQTTIIEPIACFSSQSTEKSCMTSDTGTAQAL